MEAFASPQLWRVESSGPYNIRSVRSLRNNIPLRQATSGAVLTMKGEQDGWLVLEDGSFTRKVSHIGDWVHVAYDEVSITGSLTREEKDADLRKRAIDLDVPTASKRVKNEAGSSSDLVLSASPENVDAVQGLGQLVEHFSVEIKTSALTWCTQQGLTAVMPIVEAELEDVFIQALGILEGGAAAVVLRKRLARLRS